MSLQATSASSGTKQTLFDCIVLQNFLTCHFPFVYGEKALRVSGRLTKSLLSTGITRGGIFPTEDVITHVKSELPGMLVAELPDHILRNAYVLASGQSLLEAEDVLKVLRDNPDFFDTASPPEIEAYEERSRRFFCNWSR